MICGHILLLNMNQKTAFYVHFRHSIFLMFDADIVECTGVEPVPVGSQVRDSSVRPKARNYPSNYQLL